MWADVGAFDTRFAHLLRRVDIIIFISLDAEFNYLHPRFYFVKMCPRVRALEPFKARHVLRCSTLGCALLCAAVGAAVGAFFPCHPQQGLLSPTKKIFREEKKFNVSRSLACM